MPRPKSELTKSGRTIGVRLTEWEYQEWKKLGSTKWLRELLKTRKIDMINKSFNPSQENQNALRKQTQTIQERI
jgi:hypothetical protein